MVKEENKSGSFNFSRLAHSIGGESSSDEEDEVISQGENQQIEDSAVSSLSNNPP